MCGTKNQPLKFLVGGGEGSYPRSFLLPHPCTCSQATPCPSHCPGGRGAVGLPCSLPEGGELGLVGVGGLHARIGGTQPVPRGHEPARKSRFPSLPVAFAWPLNQDVQKKEP